MLLIIGTMPDETFPLTFGVPILDGDEIVVNGFRVPVVLARVLEE